jgi:hypothetical protein
MTADAAAVNDLSLAGYEVMNRVALGVAIFSEGDEAGFVLEVEVAIIEGLNNLTVLGVNDMASIVVAADDIGFALIMERGQQAAACIGGLTGFKTGGVRTVVFGIGVDQLVGVFPLYCIA